MSHPAKARRTGPPRRPPRRPSLLTLANPARRLRIVLLVLSFVFSMFAGRLIQFQAVDAQNVAGKAQDNVRRNPLLPAPRGQIQDRSGRVLALTLDTFTVVASPKEWQQPRNWAPIKEKTKNYKEEAIPGLLRQLNPRFEQAKRDGIAQLARFLDVDQATLARKLSDPRDQYQRLAQRVESGVWRQLDGLDLPGVSAERTVHRQYPTGSTSAAVLGFLGPMKNTGDKHGKPSGEHGVSGLEKALDETLAGTDGQASYVRTIQGQQIPTGAVRRDPIPGESVRLTLDSDIQWQASRAIAEGVARTGSSSGTVVVSKVSTGEILAMATAPTFDPANRVGVEVADLNNRALTDAYEPGSTGKALTMAALIEDGKAAPTDGFNVPDSIRRGGTRIGDHAAHPVKRWTLTGILAQSSNVGTILAAEKSSKERIYQYMRSFGVGERTPLRFPGEQAGRLSSPGGWDAAKAANIPFGQGYLANSVQMASAYNTIANKGIRVPPTLVKEYIAADGQVRPVALPPSSRVVSEQTARSVARMLESVVGEDGTAPAARIEGYRVAGKTGTAQKIDPSCRCYSADSFTASFIGFAPADRPELVVSVVLQDPRGNHGGGSTAAPIFKEIMEFALKAEHVPPTGRRPALYPATW